MIVIFDGKENRALELDPLTESRLRKIAADSEKIGEPVGVVGTIVSFLIGLAEEDELLHEPVH